MTATLVKPAVGSIVLRWTNEAFPTIDVGQIIEPTGEHRWMVHTGPGHMEVWHRSTILRTVKDWREANHVSTRQLTVLNMRRLMMERGATAEMANRLASEALDLIAKGEWA